MRTLCFLTSEMTSSSLHESVLTLSVTHPEIDRLAACHRSFLPSQQTVGEDGQWIWVLNRFTVSVQCRPGCLLLCRRAAELLDSGGGSELKNKVKVLLRSQSNFTPPLLVLGRSAYGDTKGRSISIADGAKRPEVSGIIFDVCYKSADSRRLLTSPCVMIKLELK